MNFPPHLTLVVPVYNSVHYLVRMLAHLESASSVPRWDVIIVDDGSSEDLSPFFTRALAQGIPLTYARQEPRSGPGAARNAGLELAQGTYVAFSDIDDLPSIPGLINLMDTAHTLRWPIAAGSYQIDEITRVDHCVQERVPDSPQQTASRPVDWAERLFEYPAIWSFVFRRQMLVECGITFPRTYYAEDLVFLIRLSQTGPRFLQTQDHVYVHLVQQHRGSLSASSAAVATRTALDALKFLRDEGSSCPKMQREALDSWRLRISARLLASRADLGFRKRVLFAEHMTQVLIAHPVQSFQTIRRGASRRVGSALSHVPARDGDDSP